MAEKDNGKSDPKPDESGSKPSEDKKPTDSGSDNNSGSDDGKEKEISLLKQHAEEREKMEKVVADMKTEREKTEKLISEAHLEGKGFSGIGNEKKEETNHEYRLRVEKELAEGKFNK